MLTLDMKGSTPIYEQIIEQIKFHVLKGHLNQGDSIPSVRKLALELNITPGTVAKAYQELERQHIIETIRGKGTFIASNLEPSSDEIRIAECRKLLRSAIVELKVMGVPCDMIVAMVQELYKEMSVC